MKKVIKYLLKQKWYAQFICGFNCIWNIVWGYVGVSDGLNSFGDFLKSAENHLKFFEKFNEKFMKKHLKYLLISIVVQRKIK